jgi:hypothetical protein
VPPGHNPSEFPGIPAIPAQEDFPRQFVLACKMAVYGGFRTPADSAMSRMLVPSMPFSAKSEIAARTITCRFVSGFYSRVSTC